MLAIETDNVADVLVGGTWHTPQAGTFELVSGHKLFGLPEPLFRFVEADGKTVMGRLSAVTAVRLAEPPQPEPARPATAVNDMLVGNIAAARSFPIAAGGIG